MFHFYGNILIGPKPLPGVGITFGGFSVKIIYGNSLL